MALPALKKLSPTFPHLQLSVYTKNAKNMSTRSNPADALNFLDNIQLQFQQDPSKYSDFLSIMKAYKKRR